MKTNSSMPSALGNPVRLKFKLSHLFLKFNSKCLLSLGFLFLSISVVLGQNDISADFDLSSVDTSSPFLDLIASNDMPDEDNVHFDNRYKSKSEASTRSVENEEGSKVTLEAKTYSGSEDFACTINLLTSNITDNSITLTWTLDDPNSEVDYFWVFFTNGGGHQIINDPQITSITYSGLQPGTSYGVFIQAKGGGLTRCVTETINFTTLSQPDDNSQPDDPNVCFILENPVNLSDGTTNLTWSFTGTLSEVDTFLVFGMDSGPNPIAITNLQQTSLNVPTPQSGATGTFFLQAKKSGITVCNSNSVSFDSATTDNSDPDPNPDPDSNGSSLWTKTSNTDDIYFTGGNVGIGTTNVNSDWQLAVNGNIRAKKIKVETNWADYVFFNDYKLPTLQEVEQHIKEKGHLINIPSAAEVEANGVELGEMNRLLLEKIEELTLYIIQQDKSQKQLEHRIQGLESQK